MNHRVIKHTIIFFHLWVLSILLMPFLSVAFGFSEVRDIYSAPQALGMGNAVTADAYGYLANYYNPAGLAKSPKRKYEVVIIALDVIGSMGMLGQWVSQQSTGTYQLLRGIQSNPNEYYFNQFSFVPSFARRGLGLSLLTSHFLAAQSDGTNVEINAGQDLAPTVGTAVNLAGNLIKIGISMRAHVRNQIQGTYDHATLQDNESIKEHSREGIGLGVNLGALITLPFQYLPTLGIAWTDALGTRFIPSHVVNGLSSGAPDPIPQSVHTAFSVHPNIARRLRSTIALEVKHWEQPQLPWQKRVHLGLQLESERSFYFWLGLHQMYWTGGLAYRVDGGNLEFGSYGSDIGGGTDRVENRRFFFRYTVSYQ